MPITVKCTCGEEFSVQDDLAGGVACCPNCGVNVSVLGVEEVVARRRLAESMLEGAQRVSGWKRVVYQLLVATAGGAVIALPWVLGTWDPHGSSIQESAAIGALPWSLGFVLTWFFVDAFRLPQRQVSGRYLVLVGCVTAISTTVLVVVLGLILGMLLNML